MKPINYFRFYIVISVLLAGSFLLMTGCPKLEDPVIPTDKPVKVKCPIAISFIEAVMPFDRNVREVEVTINDPNGKVVTVAGYKIQKVRCEAGIINLALNIDANADQQAPYQFSIYAKAPGFFETVRTILVAGEQPQYIPIFMTGMENPTPGVTAGTLAVASTQINGNTISSDLVFTSTNNGNPGIEVLIPAGTSLRPKVQGSEIKLDKVSLAVAHGDPLSIGGGYAFPAGPLVTNATDKTGKQIATPNDPFYFNSGGWATFEMTADGVPLEVISEKILVSMPINPDLLNPTTNKPYKVGETVATWSLDNSSGQWREENIAIVVQKNNGLSFEFPVTHFSTWNVDHKGSTCKDAMGNPIDLVINYNNLDCPGPRYCELREDDAPATIPFTPTMAGETNSYALPFMSGNGSFTIMNAPSDKPNLLFRIYDNPTTPTPAVAGSFTDVNIGTDCIADGTITVPAGGNCQYYAMQFLFDATAGRADLPCNFAVWYKDVDAATYDETTDLTAGGWGYAGTVDGGGIVRTASLPPLAAGRDYRILIWWGFKGNPVGPIPTMDDTNTMRFTLQNDRVSFGSAGGGACTPIAAVAPQVLPATYTVDVQPRCLNSGGGANCTYPGAAGSFNCNDPSINTVTTRRVVTVILGDAPGGANAASLLPGCP